MSDLFIVDNADKNWKAKNYPHEWADIAHTFDIVTGYLDFGAFLRAACDERLSYWGDV